MPDLLDSDDLRLLADIGFIAASHGHMAHAKAIFGAIDAMRPDSEAAAIGLAMVDLSAANPEAALVRLNRAPVTPAVRAFRGLAYLRSGDHASASAILESVLEETPTDAAADIARAAREEARSPVQTGLSELLARRSEAP